MAETLTNAPICATQKCKRPLTFLEETNCWRCLVCNPIVKTAPTVKKKDKYIDVKLTEDMVVKIIKEQIGSAKVISLSEDQIREIVQDELANWHIQRPPVTKNETEQIFKDEYANPSKRELTEAETKIIDTGTRALAEKMVEKERGVAETIPPSSAVPKEPTWRQRAKELGVPLHKEPAGSGMRKKEDVLADMERLGEPPIEETETISAKELLGNIEKVDKDETVSEELRTEEQG